MRDDDVVVPEKPDAGMSNPPPVSKSAAFTAWWSECSKGDRPCCILRIDEFMPRFLGCFPSKRNLDTYDQLDGTSASKRPGCIFCDVSVDKGFKVVHQDAQLIAFHDRSPRAKTHLLIIPRYHVAGSVCNLAAEHLPLPSMQALARELSPRHTKAGFHIPPFSSVPHLHLHIFEPPFTLLGRFKYPIAASRSCDAGKGMSWFVSLDQAIRIVQNGGRVGLGTS